MFLYPPFRKVHLHNPLLSIKYLHLNCMFVALSRRMRFVQIEFKAPESCKKRMKMETTAPDSSSLSDIVCAMRVTAAIDI